MEAALWVSKTGLDAQNTNVSVIANNLGIFHEIGKKNFIPLKLKYKIWTAEIIKIFNNKEKYFKLCKNSHKNSFKYLYNIPDKIIDEICKS